MFKASRHGVLEPQELILEVLWMLRVRGAGVEAKFFKSGPN